MSYEGFFPWLSKEGTPSRLSFFWPFMVVSNNSAAAGAALVAKSNASFTADTVCILSDISAKEKTVMDILLSTPLSCQGQVQRIYYRTNTHTLLQAS